MKLVNEALNFLSEIVATHYNNNLRRAAIDLDVSYQTLYSWLGSRTRIPSLKALEPLLEKLHVQFKFPGTEALSYDYIPKVAALAGAGASLVTDGDTVGYYAFRHDWMSRQRINPSKCILIDVLGDSMEPLFREGDTLLVDKSDTEIFDGRIYLVTLGDELRVKHVQKSMRGLILRSENLRYADVPVEGPDLETFIVHGRVKWCGKIV